MKIKTVSIIGLGALGTMFGHHLSQSMPAGELSVIADPDRIHRYQSTGIFCNGDECNFTYITPDQESAPADLVIFGVKFNALNEAIEIVKKHIAPHTLILSMLNGISSEEVLMDHFGRENVVYCVAQEMDALKQENCISYENMGRLAFGEWNSEVTTPRVQAIEEFFIKHDFPHLVDNHMYKRMWGKFMLNVGVNQAVAVYKTDFAGIHRSGEARDTMIGAMKEVIALSAFEGANLSENDLNYWIDIVDTLNPQGKPSLAQDLEARRYSEVELFSGTVCRLGKKHGVETPVNDFLYKKIKEIEAKF